MTDCTDHRPTDPTLAPCLQVLAAAAAGGSSGYTGLWKKDTSLSDPMDEACDAVELNWVLRRALGLLNYMEVCLQNFAYGYGSPWAGENAQATL